MNCPKCGNGIPDNHTFCSKCGAKYEEKKEEKKTVPDEQHVSLLLAVLLVVSLILILLWGRYPTPM